MKVINSIANSLLLLFTMNIFLILSKTEFEGMYIYIIAGVIFAAVNIIPVWSVGRENYEAGIFKSREMLLQLVITSNVNILIILIDFAIMYVNNSFNLVNFLINVILIIVAESIIFWNGLIRMFRIADEIGEKWCLAAIFTGMLPFINIFVIGNIISMENEHLAKRK